jgi:putative pyruvate formate lyase activating enzyme
VGKTVTLERMADIFLELEKQGCHNINLVTPTHYIPHVIGAASLARTRGLKLPFVYNTSGYEATESISLLQGSIDIYLTDFKYWEDAAGARYSAVTDYRERAWAALEAMLEQTGPPRYGNDGIMATGVIVRHLLLPGRLEDAKQVVRKVFGRFGSDVALSLMNQYTPSTKSAAFPELASRVPISEYEALLDYADGLGIDEYFWQDGDATGEGFIPPFNLAGV